MPDLSKKWKPNDEQRALLLALQAECAKEPTAASFVRKFLPAGRTASWFQQIMDVFKDTLAESYFDRVSETAREKTIEELKFVLDEIPLKRLQLKRLNEFKILPTTKILALEQAIREAKGKTGPERLIINLGPTGAGKTISCNYLAKKVKARFVEVRDIWRHNVRGNVPLGDICKGVGMRSWSGRVAQAQDDLIEFCGDQDIVIVFDEGEHFGGAALNLLKLLLNKTRLIPVIFVVPEQYDKWFQSKFKNEALQIARRTHAIIDSSIVDERDCALFFGVTITDDGNGNIKFSNGENPQFADPTKAIELLSVEASRFGHFSLVRRVADKLEGIRRASEEDVKAAIKSAKRQMMRDTPQLPKP